MDFDAWLAELDRLAAAADWEGYTTQTGRSCWLDSYNDGDTPADAWDTEMSYAAEDSDA